MPRVYRVRQALIGSIYDAGKLLEDGQTKEAYTLLRHKLVEIEKASKASWCKTDWS
jgi:hypothetical protein